MRGLREPSEKMNNALYFLAGMLVVVLVFIIVVSVQTRAQGTHQKYDDSVENTNLMAADEQRKPSVGSGTDKADVVEKWQEGDVEYKGARYRYNSGLRTYLIMGIDNDEPVAEAKDGVSGGQSDAMFLLVADSDNEQFSVISINRNTMTDIDIYDENGLALGTLEAQICLQHGFGDGRKLSCSRAVDVVAKLFGNIPINGYVAMNMGGIPLMNDAVGGVEVEVLTDVSFPSKGVELRKGDTVTLGGEQAYCYLRGRDVTEYDSASDRLKRQEQYILNFMNKIKSASNGSASMAVGIYNSVADYLVTSVDFTSLITELSSYELLEEHQYTVPGETVRGETYEEYYVDEDALHDMIMEVFYIPVQ